MKDAVHNPYAGAFARPWFKGELHIHTDRHKGTASREVMLSRLRRCGFDFAAFAEHNLYTPANADTRPVLLGSAELRTRGGDVLSLGADVTAGYPGPDAPREAYPSPQETIDRVRAAGGLPFLAHPKIAEFTTNPRHWTFHSEQLNRDLARYAGLEIYTHYVGSGFQTAVDRLDALWIYRLRSGQRPVRIWGLATADAHGPNDITPHVGILVAASSCNPPDLLAAIEAGRFYALAASTARFRQIGVDDQDRLHVVAEGARLLRCYGVPQAEHRGDRRQLALAWAEGRGYAALDYALRGTEGYVRVEAMDRYGNSIYANPLALLP